VCRATADGPGYPTGGQFEQILPESLVYFADYPRERTTVPGSGQRHRQPLPRGPIHLARATETDGADASDFTGIGTAEGGREPDLTVAVILERTAPGEASVYLADESATLALGQRLAAGLVPGLKIYLSGDLGAGKTTLVRGVLRALGYRGRVKSPTFTLVELYTLSRLDLYHFDFYRFEDPREWVDAGFREAFDSAAVCVVEWPEKAAAELPPADLAIVLEHCDEGRRAHVAVHTEAGESCFERMMT